MGRPMTRQSRPSSRTRRYLMGLALGEPVAVRMTLMVIAGLAVVAAIIGALA